MRGVSKGGTDVSFDAEETRGKQLRVLLYLFERDAAEIDKL